MKNLNTLIITGISTLTLAVALQGMQRQQTQSAGGLTILSMLQQKKRSERPESAADDGIVHPRLKRARTTLSLQRLAEGTDLQEFKLAASSAATTAESHPTAGSDGREEHKQMITGAIHDTAESAASAFSNLRIDVDAAQLFTHVTEEELPIYLQIFIQQRGLKITSIRQPFTSHADPYAYIVFDYLSCIKYHPDNTVTENCILSSLPLKYLD